MNHAATERAGFWQRRIRGPVVAQLTQGISAGRIALTISLGITLGIFPILGATSILSGIAAWILKLNQPIIQAVTVLTFPLQCLLLLPFYRAGESLFGIPSIPLSIPLIVFCVTFGLSMDYEVFILARVREEYLKDRDSDGSVRRGLVATGGLITGAAAIMITRVGEFQGTITPTTPMGSRKV